MVALLVSFSPSRESERKVTIKKFQEKKLNIGPFSTLGPKRGYIKSVIWSPKFVENRNPTP